MIFLVKREKDLQDKVIEYLKERNIYVLNIHGGGWGGRGTPDLLLCLNGKFVALELKVEGNKLEPAQIIHKRKIERNGGLHYAPYSFAEFVEIMNELGVE